MTRISTSIRVTIVLFVIGLLAQLSAGEYASWAAPGQDVERQTLPTFTPTPGQATDTPVPPPTDTPAPSLPSATPSLAATAALTGTATLTGTSTLSEQTPAALPEAGASPLWLGNGALLLACGALALLAGGLARRKSLGQIEAE